jgi:uncharacterized protein with von Willebrand factor type A (vWA) domain
MPPVHKRLHIHLDTTGAWLGACSYLREGSGRISYYWLNPLAGLPGYSPLARGMRAALPYLDDLLPAGTGEELLAFLRRLKNLP